jgi:hypothetical protein
MKSAIAVFLAMLGLLLAFPGVASAHHPVLDGESDCVQDGTWSVVFTVGNSETNTSNWTSFDDATVLPGRDMQISSYSASAGSAGSPAAAVVPPSGETTLTVSGIPDGATAVTLSVTGFWRYYMQRGSTSESVSSPKALIDVAGDDDWFGARNTVTSTETATVGHPNEDCNPEVTVCYNGEPWTGPANEAPEDTGDCGEVEVCIDGQFVTVTEYEANQGIDTGDCGEVEVCIDGQFTTVTEYEASQLQDTGDCGEVEVCVDGHFITVTEYEAGQLEDTGDCGNVRICLDGRFVRVPESDAQLATNDCGIVEICVDGDTVNVTEFKAEELLRDGATEGECDEVTFSDPTPQPTIVATTNATPEPMTQVSAEEVVALPSTGQGHESGGLPWLILVSTMLVGIGSGAAFSARR